MGKLSTPKCPSCGSDCLRSCESVAVTYGLRIEKDGTWEYDDMGGEVHYDTATNVADLDNEIRLDCKDCGHEWTAQLLEEK